MNKEYKKTWLKALRSGKFKQGRNQLRQDAYDVDKDEDLPKGPKSEYCCLGVLCEVTRSRYDGYDGGLTRHQQKKFGLKDEIADKLIGLNDGNPGKPRSFKYIANWIERNL